MYVSFKFVDVLLMNVYLCGRQCNLSISEQHPIVAAKPA